ncbi:MAG: HEAT repeat domain-containing protein [Planctomycetota bacterium]
MWGRVAVLVVAFAGCACRPSLDTPRGCVEVLLSADSEEEFFAAQDALAAFGADAVVPLIDALAKRWQTEGFLAWEDPLRTALLRLDESALSPLLVELDSEDSYRRYLALDIILSRESGQNPGPMALAKCRERLRDPIELIRHRAAMGLHAHGEKPAEAVPHLLARLLEPERSRRQYRRIGAARSLSGFDDAIPEIVTALMKTAREPHEKLRETALESLMSYWAADARVWTFLREIASADDVDLRVAALRTIGSCPAPTDEVIEVVLASMDDEDERVRQAARASLERLWAARPMSPAAHREMLRHPNPQVRIAACLVVEHARTVSVRELKPPLADKVYGVRLAAVRALTFYAPRNEEARDELARLLENADSDDVVRFHGDINVLMPAAFALIEADHHTKTAMRYFIQIGYTKELLERHGDKARALFPGEFPR